MRLIRAVFFFIIVSSLLAVSSFGALSENLTSYWNFEETVSGSNVLALDQSGTNSLSPTGYRNYSLTGKIGNTRNTIAGGAVFNYFQNTSSSVNFTNSSNYTVNMWVYRNASETSDGIYLWLGQQSGSISMRWQNDNCTVASQVRPFVFQTGGTIPYSVCQAMPLQQWQMMTLIYDSTNRRQLGYVNGSLFSNTTIAPINRAVGNNKAMLLGSTNSDAYLIDEAGLWNRTLTNAEILQLYNSGVGLSYAQILSGTSLDLTAKDYYDGTLSTFTVNASNGTNDYQYSTVTGNITAGAILVNSTTLWNITFCAPNFICNTYYDYNVSTNLLGQLFRTALSPPMITGNMSVGTYNYVRNAIWAVNVTNCTGVNVINTLVDGAYANQTSVDCGASLNNVQVSGSYIDSTEGIFNLSFYVNGTDYAYYWTNNTTLISDLNNPNISLQYNTSSGFVNVSEINVSLQCNDTIFSPLYYNITFDTTAIYGANKTGNTTQQNNSINMTNGEHTLYGICSDYFGSSYQNYTFENYVAFLILWDEVNNVPLDLTYVNDAKLWQEDNGTSYNFKTNGRNNITVVFSNVSKYRIDLNYSAGISVYRYVDIQYLDESVIKVCANRDGKSYYQQLIYSSIVTPVFLKNSYTACYVIADETRFAYSDAYSVAGYTIDSDYYLYEYEDGEFTALASIDGTTSVIINLDNLKFTREGYDISFSDDALVFSESSTVTNATEIYYKNIQNDNSASFLEIYREDDGTLLLNITNITTPNNWQTLFAWGNYPNTNESTMFIARLYNTKSDGSLEVIEQYFDALARSGVINTAVGVMISVGLVIGGLSMFAISAVLSWLGIIIVLLAVIVNALTIPNDVTYILYWAYGVILMFQIIILFAGNKQGLN